MTKDKRKKYGIRKLKRECGLSYVEIGARIRKSKKTPKMKGRGKKSIPKVKEFKEVASTTSSSIKTKRGGFKYLTNLIRKIYVWIIKHFKKKEGED